MPTLFEMYLTGLCEFVPKYDFGDPAHLGKNQMRVLLANSSHHFGTGHEQHLPVLVCEYSRVDRSPGNRIEDDTFVYQNTTWAIFNLIDQDLRIDGASPEKLNVPNLGGGGTACSATPANYRDFAWVGPIGSITPGAGTVKNACLAAANVDPFVIARVALTQGTIETAKLARDGDRQIALWAFEPDQIHRRVLADLVRFWANIGTVSAKLWTNLLRTTTDPTVSALYPHGPGSQLPIVIDPVANKSTVYVFNMPDPDIRQTRPAPPPGPRSPDVHFYHFYDLSTTPGSRNIPSQVAVCPESNPIGPHQGNPNCPPVRTSANLLA